MSTLYLVATPIGNLADITLRALQVVFHVAAIVCEDTREIIKILNKYRQMKQQLPQLWSYSDRHPERITGQVIHLLQRGQDVALVSDRGTPLISDPGHLLVKKVLALTEIDLQIKVVSLPGANAILPAVQLSGLPADKFYFSGFLPKKLTACQKVLLHLPSTTIVAFVSPHRLLATLRIISDVLGPKIQIAVCRELTKVYEQVYRSQVQEAIKHYSLQKVKGEITLVFRKV